MIRLASIVAGVLCVVGTTWGQNTAQGVPGYPMPPNPYAGVYAPNFYNRSQQPLSPYLNMLRGGNPAVDYFYGARPGTQPGGQLPGGGFGTQGPTNNGMTAARVGFFGPAAANPTQDPITLPEAGKPIDSLSPSGHPVTFGLGGFNRPGQNGSRPGIFGNQPPAAFSRGKR
jgi:hypothetical protein